MSITKPIFKFMSVRGVNLEEEGLSPFKFFRRLNQLSKNSPFIKGLLKLAINKRKEYAKGFLDEIKKSNNLYDKDVFKIYNQITEIASDDNLKNGLTSKQKGDLDKLLQQVKTKFKAAQVESHWDALIASIVSNNLDHDRAKLINPLRAFHLANHAAEAMKDTELLSSILKAKPLISKDMFFKVDAKTPTKQPDTKPSQTDIAKGEVDRYKKALSELDLANRNNKRAISKLSLAKKPPKLKSKGDLKTNKEATFEMEQPGPNPFVFLPGVTKGISADTKKIISENNLSFEDRISVIKSRLEERQQINIVKSTAGKGVRQIMSAAGNAWSSRSKTSAVSSVSSPASAVTVPTQKGEVKPIGIGDLILVEEELIKYQTHEIAHVENILQSEFKERVHRKFEQQEESYLFESETTNETEHDLQKAERYELQKETELTIATDQQAGAGVSVSAGYGPVSVSANANYSISNSVQSSVSKATTFAKDITERSVSKIIQRTLEQSSSKTLYEVEETNTHGFDNKDGDGHVIGIYQYLEKVYRAQMYNYGKRLMFEFMVPEPSAFYKYSLTNQSLPGMTLSMPDDEILDLDPSDISRTGYLALVKLYQAQGVNPPPPETAYVTKAFYKDYTSGVDYTGLGDNELKVPTGYYADRFNVDRAFGINQEDKAIFKIVVGDRRYDIKSGDIQDYNLNELTETVPIVIKTSSLTNWGVTVEIECSLTNEKMQEWQMETYGALLDAYNGLKSAYEDQLAEAQKAAGVGQFGQSDEMNRVTEKTELKRACLTLLTDQHFDLFDAMNYPSSGGPELDVDESMAEGKYVQFFEQAFEWENITYHLYPYFWGKKDMWLDNMNIMNRDVKFQEFLKAGFAKALVPVRPGYDEAVIHFLETGEIWLGGEVPGIDDELYVSILEEIYDGHDTEKEKLGEPWELTVPTNLVYLKPDSSLPTFE